MIDEPQSREPAGEGDQARIIHIASVVRRSFAAVIHHRLALLNLTRVPFLLLAAVGTVLLVLEMQFKVRLWASIAFQGGMYLLLLPVVTSWHRLLLLGTDSRVGYRFGHEEFIYMELLLGLGILISLFLLVSGLLFVTPLISGASWIVGTTFTEWTCRLIAWLMSFVVVCRFLLALPAAALGREMRIAASSHILHGNVLRFIAAYVVVLIAPQSLLWYVGDPSSWILRGYTGNLQWVSILGSFYLGLAATLVFWALSAAMVSFAYKSLISEPGQGKTTARPDPPGCSGKTRACIEDAGEDEAGNQRHGNEP